MKQHTRGETSHRAGQQPRSKLAGQNRATRRRIIYTGPKHPINIQKLKSNNERLHHATENNRFPNEKNDCRQNTAGGEGLAAHSSAALSSFFPFSFFFFFFSLNLTQVTTSVCSGFPTAVDCGVAFGLLLLARPCTSQFEGSMIHSSAAS